MVIIANDGPSINFGVTLSASGAPAQYNEERGPSLADLGEGLLDPRPQFCYKPGAAVGTPVMAWAGLFGGPVIDQIPSAHSSNGVVLATSAPTSGVFTINSSGPTAANIAQTTLIDPVTGISTTPWAIDGAMVNSKGVVSGAMFGTGATIGLWDPTKAITRALVVSFSSGTGTGAMTINGRDLYGFKLSQVVPESSAGTFTTLKAFKYISSIVSSGTLASTAIYVGVADVFGFPLRVDTPAYLTAWWGNSTAANPTAAIITALSTTGGGTHNFAQTVTATSTTGDVRGTLTITSTFTAGGSSVTSNRLQVNISPSVSNLQSITTSNFSGLVGVAQFSAF